MKKYDKEFKKEAANELRWQVALFAILSIELFGMQFDATSERREGNLERRLRSWVIRFNAC